MSAAPDLAPLAGALPEAVVDAGFGPPTVDVPPDQWPALVRWARDEAGCDFLDFLSAVDEPDALRLVCHVAALSPLRHVLLRTSLPRDAARVASVADLFPGAAWHERETAEMFGVTFLDGSGAALDLPGLLLPPGFAGHPLRKDFELTARTDRPWPGSKDPA